MIKKKAGKKPGKKSKKRKADQKKPLDAGKVREEILGLVREEAKAITVGVVDKAKHGSLAQAKYLFEVAEIFPQVEGGEEATEEEDESLAKLLLELKPPKKLEEDEEGNESEDPEEKKAEEAAIGA